MSAAVTRGAAVKRGVVASALLAVGLLVGPVVGAGAQPSSELGVAVEAPGTADAASGQTESASVESASVESAALGAPSLAAGQTLRPGMSVRSPSGSYQFVLQTDGNAVVYGPSGAVWWTGTRGSALSMQTDGNLVLYAAGPVWHAGTFGNPNAALYLRNDGSLAVVAADGRVLWETNPDPALPRVALTPGQSLRAGQELRVLNGAVRLIMQTDGNLVRYESGVPTWWSGTAGASATLVLQTDGNAVIYTTAGPVWSTGTHGRAGNYFVLQTDANVVLYGPTGALWASGTSLKPRDAVVVSMVNQERAKVGCAPLAVDSRLNTAARLHSEDMARRNYFSHNSPEGGTPSTRASAQGYTTGVGENIAAGYLTPEAVMSGWMTSAGHRDNILNCRYKTIGMGSADGGPSSAYRLYWTQNFGVS